MKSAGPVGWVGEPPLPWGDLGAWFPPARVWLSWIHQGKVSLILAQLALTLLW